MDFCLLRDWITCIRVGGLGEGKIKMDEFNKEFCLVAMACRIADSVPRITPEVKVVGPI